MCLSLSVSAAVPVGPAKLHSPRVSVGGGYWLLPFILTLGSSFSLSSASDNWALRGRRRGGVALGKGQGGLPGEERVQVRAPWSPLWECPVSAPSADFHFGDPLQPPSLHHPPAPHSPPSSHFSSCLSYHQDSDLLSCLCIFGGCRPHTRVLIFTWCSH